jgi:hypothetical protein
MSRASFAVCISLVSFTTYPFGSAVVVFTGSFVLFLPLGRSRATIRHARVVDGKSRQRPLLVISVFQNYET